MEDKLTITLIPSQALLLRYNKLATILNKQTAHVNFQTLAAGWYEDEKNVLGIDIYIIDDVEFQQQLTLESLGDRTEISDDVLLYTKVRQLICFVSITHTEMELLENEPKILSGYITMKIRKVINEIAKNQGLLPLPE